MSASSLLQNNLTHNEIKRLARRGGVKRMSGQVYDEINGVLRDFLGNVVQKAVIFSQHAHRMHVVLGDVIMALKSQGITLYGYDQALYVYRKVGLAGAGDRARLLTAADARPANPPGDSGSQDYVHPGIQGSDPAGCPWLPCRCRCPGEDRPEVGDSCVPVVLVVVGRHSRLTLLLSQGG